MTKRWSSTASGDGKIKRRAFKEARAKRKKHPDLVQNDPAKQPTLEDGRRVKQVTMETCPVCGASYAMAIICSDDTVVPLNATCFLCHSNIGD